MNATPVYGLRLGKRGSVAVDVLLEKLKGDVSDEAADWVGFLNCGTEVDSAPETRDATIGLEFGPSGPRA